nr:MAG TPA: hypothetical protein [Caudoviricetes sp.]
MKKQKIMIKIYEDCAKMLFPSSETCKTNQLK